MRGRPYEIVILDGPCVGARWNEAVMPAHRIEVNHLVGALVGTARQVPDLAMSSLIYECVEHIGLEFHYRFVEAESVS